MQVAGACCGSCEHYGPDNNGKIHCTLFCQERLPEEVCLENYIPFNPITVYTREEAIPRDQVRAMLEDLLYRVIEVPKVQDVFLIDEIMSQHPTEAGEKGKG